MSKGLVLLCDSHHGVYIPQLMAQRLREVGWAIWPDHVVVCDAGPDNEEYWQTWTYILDHAIYTDESYNKWQLYQDGDLWAYCDELMSEEEKENFFGGY